jgi:hypothetical protein
MKKNQIIGLVALVVVLAVGLAAALILQSSITPTLQPTKDLDFTVSGKSDCLRFLNDSVPTIYVPFTVAANENLQLTINCTKMPGGVNGWTDVYIYKGYWDLGANNTCTAAALYPIISDIQSVDFEIKASQPYTETFGGSTQQSYTVFFLVPPGGPAAFHVTLKKV